MKNTLSVHYVDHFACNDSKQDMFAIVLIIDALFFRILQWSPQMRNISLSSDNEKCYLNDIVGPLSYVVRKFYRLVIYGYVYPNSQCPKGLVDSHFAVLKRWVDTYVKEKQADESYPTDLVIALKQKGVLPNTSVELISINRHSANMKEIRDVEKRIHFVQWADARNFVSMTRGTRFDFVHTDTMAGTHISTRWASIIRSMLSLETVSPKS